MFRVLLSFLAFSALGGCASVTSTSLSTETELDTPFGLTYYLPRRDIAVEIDMADVDGDLLPNSVTITGTEVYADRSKSFVLNHEANVLADNKVTVKVSSSGLLQTTTASSTSQVEEALVELAGSAANVGGLMGIKPDGKETHVCRRAGKYTFILPPEGLKNMDTGVTKTQFVRCGVIISVKKLDEEFDSFQEHQDNEYVEDGKRHSGIFYRQERPYLVHARVGEENSVILEQSTIITSPNRSATHYLPISRSFFADSKATFTFEDGMPIDYDQDDKSEVVGALIIPAKVIGAYFKAAGELFTAFSSNQENQVKLLESEKKLELAKGNAERDLAFAKLKAENDAQLATAKAELQFQLAIRKLDLCIAAVEAENDDLVKELECGKIQ